ncbi:putative ribonuclease H-like domain-containing protein [Tanacetum coccineum]
MNKKYCLVVTDDYSRFTWVFFLASKDETSGILKSFITEIENLVDKKVKIIRCDNGTEFKNRVMSEFCEKKGIKREFSIARTPQQNGVAERRNRTLIEAARTMLADSKLPTTFWAEAVNTACYVQNRVIIVKPHNKTPYELFRGKLMKVNEGFVVRYSLNSKCFRYTNIRTRKVEENLHIRFLEDKPIIVGTEESVGTCHSSKETGSSQDYILIPLWKDGSLFDSSSKNASNDEPQPSSDAGKNDGEGVSKESEIDDQEKPENSTQDVNTAGPSINTASTNFHTGSLNINTVSPTVTPAPLEATHADFFDDESELDMRKITTTYPSGVLTRRMTKTTNEQGLISTVYEGKTHEDLHTCLFACFLSQEELKKMDVKSAFLYCKIKEEVYVCQPLGFEDPEFPNKVYKVEKELYVLHQAPRAWYETLSTYLLDNGFKRGQIDKTLFIKRVKCDILLVQMSSMGELTFFLRLQVTQKDDGIFISHDKYVDEILKKFGFSTVKTTSTPMETSKPLLKDSEAEDVDIQLHDTKDFLDKESNHLALLRDPGVHSKTKHIKIRHHFIRDSNEKKLIQMIKIHTDQNVADLLTKAFDGPVVQGEGLTHPVESHHIPTSAPSTSPPQISPTPRIPTRQESEVPQPRAPTQTPAADKAVSTCVDVKHGGAATTVTSLDAGQGSGNINKTSYMPHDSPLPSGHTLGSDESRMQHNELMDLDTKLSDRVVALETDSQQTKKIYGTAFTKLIKKVKKLKKTFKSSQARRKAKIVVSNDEDLEDPFKQGMKIAEIDQDPDISLVQHNA